jgi:hypothetical protein
MAFSFRPAKTVTDRHGLFVGLTGGTNSGKSFSALRLARGIAGPNGKIACIDTEGGRLLHLREYFDFNWDMMSPPFHPAIFAEGVKQAEGGDYNVVLIDSFSQAWSGLGGTLDQHEQNLANMWERAKARPDNRRSEYQVREAGNMAAWIKPKAEWKNMVYALLQRRIPIIFSIRGEETVKPGESGKPPTKIFKAVCEKSFPFEITVSFRLKTEAKGIIDLSDPRSFKMEGAHRAIFQDGEQISEAHGEALAAWARGEVSAPRAVKSPISLDEWIDVNLPAQLADCGTPEQVIAVKAGRAYLAATERATDDQLARMNAHVDIATARIIAAGYPTDGGDNE